MAWTGVEKLGFWPNGPISALCPIATLPCLTFDLLFACAQGVVSNRLFSSKPKRCSEVAFGIP